MTDHTAVTQLHAKLDRADQHLRAFSRWTKKALPPTGPTIPLETFWDAKDRTVGVRLGTVPTPSLALCIRLGEAAYALRSCLDQAVYALRIADTGSARGSHTQFPIIDKAADWDERKLSKSHLSGLNDAHVQLVRSFQPFSPLPRGIPGHNRHPLLTLSALNNDDKHRVLQPLPMSFPRNVMMGERGWSS